MYRNGFQQSAFLLLEDFIARNYLLRAFAMQAQETIPKNETIALRDKHIGKSCQLFFKANPLKIIRGAGQYMYDENGQKYLDCINNVAHVGHCHPAVTKAGSEQMATLYTNNRFLHDNLVLYAQRLTKTLPPKLSVCFFVNSGSEANDLALRLSQIHTGNDAIITLEHAYHGHLTSLIDISHYKFNLPGGPAKKDHVYLASCPDIYRGKYRDTEYKKEELGKVYADEVAQICEKIKEERGGVCAYIAESMLSCGGQIIPPQNYFKEVYKHVRAAGGVCIADEVQVGFGRVGKRWWAFELQDVVPDIVTMGKPMGNGHPVAAVVTTEEIAESFRKTGVEYFNTYGGNPVSCAIANAVMDVIENEKLREQALVVGEYIMDSCKMLAKKHKIIGDVRGEGLFIGIELVKDRKTKIPDKEAATYVISRMKDEHIILSTDGPDANVLKLKPPMVFNKENAELFVSLLDKLLDEVKEIEFVSTQNSVTTNGHSEASKETRPRKSPKEQLIKSI